MKPIPDTAIENEQQAIPEKPILDVPEEGIEHNQADDLLDTRGESGNLSESRGFSAGPGEAVSSRNKIMEGARQGRSEA